MVFKSVKKILFGLLLVVQSSFASIYINEIMASNKGTILDPDSLQYADWIELYNSGPFTVDLGGAFLTDDFAVPDKWRIPAGTTIPAGGFLLIWADGADAVLQGLHTNFKLNKDGESVGLYAADGTVVDALTIPKLYSDISYGRDASAPQRRLYFAQPTPGKANAPEGFLSDDRAGKVTISLASGFYRGPQAVILSSSPSATIYYTTDGSTPTRTAKIYQTPLVVTRSFVLKARAFEPCRLPGPVETHTFFIDEETSLPVVSLSAAPADLFSQDHGIYVDKNVEKRRNWERPATLEFFETDGSLQFAQNVDLRLFGRTAIYIPQKSLAVYLSNTLNYPLFPNDPIRTFDSFILRSSSDDWHRTMFRDGFIQSLIRRTMRVDTQAYRPAVVFINGEYYGIHNIREKYNGDYLAAHHGIDPSNIDMLYIDERQPDPVTILDGDRAAYDELIRFVKTNDLRQAENYAQVLQRVDIDHFIDYVIAEGLTGNTSWAHNIRCWRPRTPQGKWQWLVFDMDRGFRDRNFNAFADMADKFELFHELLKNEEFRRRFVERFVELLNASWTPARMTVLLDSLQQGIAEEIHRHIERWKDYCGNGVCGIPSITDWQNNVADMRSIVQARPAIARQQVGNLLNLGREVRLDVQVQKAGYGEVTIDESARTSSSFSGVYFPGMTVNLQARPFAGFSFVGWYGASTFRTVLLSRGSQWQYFDENMRPADNWFDHSFDDADWKNGRAQFGYGENDEATVVHYGTDAAHKYMTCYFRARFVVSEPAKVKTVLFKLLRDDGAVVYLNGSELFRSNMPNGPISHTTPATTAIGGNDEDTFFEFSFPGAILKCGENLVAVEIHQNSPSSSDLSFDLEIEAEQLGGDQLMADTAELAVKMDGDRSLIALFAADNNRTLPETITADLRLTSAGSPYLALGSVMTAPGASLTLSPGVEIRFAEGADLIVRGRLAAEGTEDMPVFLRGIGNGRWGAVCFDHTATASHLSFVTIDGATTGSDAARFNAAVAMQSSEVILDHVTFTDVGQPFNASGGRITMRHCVLDGTKAGDDILHAANASVIIDSCRLFGNGELDFDSVDHGVIRNSVIEIISDNGNRDGIDIGASQNVLIEGNRIFHTPDKGISVGEKSRGVIIRRNLVVNASMGIAVKDSSETTIDHCTFYDAAVGVSLYEKVAGQGGGKAAVSNSIFAGRFTAEYEAANRSSVQFAYCLSEKSLLPGEGNLKGDALFISPLSGNFELTLNSPCIDAGDPDAPLDADGTRSDIGAFFYYFGPAKVSGLFINEIMAANASILADEAGEFEDWFEIYNAGDTAVDLAGLYLTDDLRNPTQWRIPTGAPQETTVPAKGYLLFWADGQPQQGIRHAPFKLNADGERLALIKLSRTGVLYVDSLSYAAQQRDISLGRYPDGTAAWYTLEQPTPAAANRRFPAGVEEGQDLPKQFAVHPASPNPFNARTIVVYELPKAAVVTAEVFNLLGRKISLLLQEKKEAGVHRIMWEGVDGQGLTVPSGVYFCRVTAGNQSILQKMVLVH